VAQVGRRVNPRAFYPRCHEGFDSAKQANHMRCPSRRVRQQIPRTHASLPRTPPGGPCARPVRRTSRGEDANGKFIRIHVAFGKDGKVSLVARIPQRGKALVLAYAAEKEHRH
jgi:hypothetical protein